MGSTSINLLKIHSVSSALMTKSDYRISLFPSSLTIQQAEMKEKFRKKKKSVSYERENISKPRSAERISSKG